MSFETLIESAVKVVNPQEYSRFAEGGSVGAALLTVSGKVYTGICIDTACSMGFCAEHAAAAEMLKAGESRIVEVVAVKSAHEILAPCGRCREFLTQLNSDNYKAQVMLPDRSVRTLGELLPVDFKDGMPKQ